MVTAWSKRSASSASASATPRAPGRARVIALRLSASFKQSWLGCSHAPLPGRRDCQSTTTSGFPSAAIELTSRTRRDRESLCLHAMQVRTGGKITAAEAVVFLDFTTNAIMPNTHTTGSPQARSHLVYRLPPPLSDSARRFEREAAYCAAASETMSMRQPVSLAAKRAF